MNHAPSVPVAADKLIHLLDLSFDELSALLEDAGIRPVHTGALWRTLHRESATPLADSNKLPPPVRRWLNQYRFEVAIDQPTLISEIESSDGYTRKLLLRLEDGHEIETVIMGYPGRFTVCLSTQVGCAMGCVFCATGQMGFTRQLRVGEIVAQVHSAQQVLNRSGNTGLRNAVLMGMGEPLHNYDASIKAMQIVCDNRGIGLGESRITISSVGVVPAIRRFADEKHGFNLAVSLHASNDTERVALIPVNQRWPITDILDSCRYYTETTGKRVLFGWTLIDGKNDSPDEARRVANLLKGQDAHVNLIRLNPTDGFGGSASARTAAETFSDIIQESGIPCTLRQRRGIDVAAGCGQLAAKQ
ncbi:MAG: 23S rRNA (adenine(2503)-C(2))-methyltransferase RlmN [Verrucomicrobiales bacterium]|nr:23S rRNA (adenine(2503)-C(2))-methyltransferase RlmN [Verrucomicrobiales bacterium]|tara:strand:- start:3202 stop:4281 length:1080 start_codon:yes stop_codon:yes gene_type:complete